MVLAGGASRRLAGVPKGLERVGDMRIVDRVATALRDVTQDLLVAANDPAAGGWLPGVPVVRDRRPGAGGLAGVEAALSTDRDVLVVAWDMPFVPPSLLRELLVVAETRGADAVFPESDSPHGFEPFCAYYSRRVRESLRRYLESGGGAAHALVGHLRNPHFLGATDVARLGDPRRLFFSVNTAADLRRARAMAAETK